MARNPNPYNLKSGDVLAFGSCSWTSMIIAAGQCSVPYLYPNHVGIVCRTPDHDLVLFESLIGYGKECLCSGAKGGGVQAHSPRLRILHHRGRIWHYPLAQRIGKATERRLALFLKSHIGKPYDYIGAFRSRQWSVYEEWINRKEDLNRIFCSEYCAAALSYIDVIKTVESNRFNPRRFCRELISQGAVRPKDIVRIK